MRFYQIKMALYASFITNYFGFKLKRAKSSQEKKNLRREYSYTLLEKLKLDVKVLNPQCIPHNGQFLLVSNHRSVIDPLIIELALQNSTLFGHWISKKELFNSFFFGLFVRNAGAILLDREKSQMGSFFSEIKSVLESGDSVFIFPEGTRNKSNSPLADFKEGSRLISVKNKIDILPLYIKTNADEVLMESLQDGDKRHVIEVVIGEIISYKERTKTLHEIYSEQFHINKEQ
jgi:1-acyl-sn-glycerol-3-phosphate acyltransferase